MTEHNIFDESEADLDRQKFEALWNRYGVWIIVAALGIVLATASATVYRSWNNARNLRLTSELLAASKPDVNIAKSIALLQKFADENPGTRQADFAFLRAGALAIDENDTAKAAGFFDRVANDAKADSAFRQLGDLLSVQVQLDSGNPATLAARLQPLTEEREPWRYSALEEQGYLAIRAGDKAKARQIFAGLSQDIRAPQTIGARATDVLRSLN